MDFGVNTLLVDVTHDAKPINIMQNNNAAKILFFLIIGDNHY